MMSYQKISFLSLIFLFLSSGCATSMQSMRGNNSFETDSVTAEEREEALASLLAQADANAGQQNYDAPLEIPLRLEPTTAEVLVENMLYRSAVDRFLNYGPYIVFGVVSLLPARNNGQLLGYLIDDVYEGGEYILASGLQRGDIVRTVNGISVLNPDDIMVLWEQLEEAETLDIVYLREGNEQILHYDIVTDVASVD